MYYFLFPFIYKKINNKFYYLNERLNKLTVTVLQSYRFDTKMNLSFFMKYKNDKLRDIIAKNKLMINEYLEHFIKEYTNE